MKRGFTLVELSIVLVIIGLLIGGILVAQSMISSSKLVNLVRTLQHYEVAAQNFKTKYRQLPGDSNKFSTAPGNADGAIESDSHIYQQLASSTPKETFYFWQQLNMSSDIVNEQFTAYSGPNNFPGDFKGLVPKLNYGTDCYLTAYTMTISKGNDQDFGNSWVIAAGGSQSITKCMTALEAMTLDRKLDDGIPAGGSTQEMYPYSGPRVAQLLGCDNNTTTDYNLKGNWSVPVTSPACALAIKANWD